MSRKQMPWFRWYVEAFSDLKLRRLTPAQRWLFAAVCGAARQSPIAGVLMVSEREPMGYADLASFAGMTVRDVERAMPLFEAAELVVVDPNLGAWRVKAWQGRQYDSDDVTRRVRKHRSKEQGWNVPRNDDETFHETGLERAQKTETDTEPPQGSNGTHGAPLRDEEEALVREARRRLASRIETGASPVIDPDAWVARCATTLRAERWRPPNPDFIPGSGPLNPDREPIPAIADPMPDHLRRTGRHPIETEP